MTLTTERYAKLTASRVYLDWIESKVGREYLESTNYYNEMSYRIEYRDGVCFLIVGVPDHWREYRVINTVTERPETQSLDFELVKERKIPNNTA